MMKLAILGATGSIGTQTLEVLKTRKDYELVAVSCNKNKKALSKILSEFKTIRYAFISSKKDADQLSKRHKKVIMFSGEQGIESLIKHCYADVYVNSILGFNGLVPSLKIIENDKILLLANKESLVCGGSLVNRSLKRHKKAKLIPIDSEHVAISKCLFNENKKDIKNLIITASGGKFFETKREDLKKITREKALSHPNWNMGQKITIDSNTMMNKTFELIEAYYLFNIPFKKISAVVNRESYVHGFIRFNDKDLAQVSKPTMLEPIRYALDFYKERNVKYDDVEENSLEKYEFKSLSLERFPVLNYAKFVVNHKGNSGCVLNAADEEAVYAFLNGKLEFYQIELVVDIVMKTFKFSWFSNLESLIKTDLRVREYTRKIIEEM